MSETITDYKIITDYDAATTIDASNDYFLIEQGGVYKSINRNTALSLASAPVGLTDSQTLTNKVLTNPTINGATLSGTLSGTYTIGGTPTFPSSVVTLTGSQTLTNKIITGPTISGGSIDNSTITVDSISGHTSGTIVTVANLQISNGVLNSANAVTATSIAAGAIQPQALVTGTGTGWAWSSWTPTFTNFTKGSATITSTYIQIGKTVFFKLIVILAADSSMGTTPSFTLPVTSVSNNTLLQYGFGDLYDSSANATFSVIMKPYSTTVMTLQYLDGNGQTAGITASAPMIWAVNDAILIQGFYEAA